MGQITLSVDDGEMTVREKAEMKIEIISLMSSPWNVRYDPSTKAESQSFEHFFSIVAVGGSHYIEVRWESWSPSECRTLI